MNKRGQAALEFLTSYGWAILVVLVMIGALSSFGILTPGTFLPERCNIDPSFSCVEYNALKEQGQVNVILRNQLGLTIDTIEVINATVAGSSVSVTCVEGLDSAGSFSAHTGSFGPGSNIWLRCAGFDGDDWATIGSKENFEIVISYTAQGRSLPRSVTADLYVNVQP